jgi:hypothetical protein
MKVFNAACVIIYHKMWILWEKMTPEHKTKLM